MQSSSKTYEIHEDELMDGPDGLRPHRRSPYGVLLVLVLVAAGFGAHWGWKERQRLLGELGKATQDQQAMRALEGRVSTLGAEKAALLAEREALQKNVQEKESALAALKKTHDEIQEKLKAEIATGDIALTQSGGRLRVDMVDKILFDSGDAQISRRGQNVLARVGAILANVPDRQIQVSGHTDNQAITGKLTAQFPTNWELSAGRALNVVRFLQEQAHVPADRLVASGHGEHQPIASNKSAPGRARNRRIEILLTPTLAPAQVSKAKLEAGTATARR